MNLKAQPGNEDQSPPPIKERNFPVLVRKDSRPFIRKPLPSPEEHGDTHEFTSVPTAPQLEIVSHTFGNTLDIDYPDKQQPSSSSPSSQTLTRHLSLFDLVSVGVGGTIGSGLFVLCGLVSHEFAGPATALSWAVSGLAACMSGCCYAELSGRIPLAGSAYAYTYVAMGELPAMLAAACLSLEYIAAAAAVSRSWGDKCVAWIQEEFQSDHWAHRITNSGGSWNPFALLVSTVAVAMLLNGVKESKRVTNIFTSIKMTIAAFMVVFGFVFVRPSNWSPFIPPQFGISGIYRGATATFFGYLGYDGVCCLGGEAKNPKRNLPIAILCTLGGVSVLYVLAALSLTGMQNYEDISPISGFPAAFRANKAIIASEITAFGEILTLPIVVLISIMAQPRLQYAMAEDGLLPSFFSDLDAKGNLFKGTLVAGGLVILISSFVPFQYLNDMISCAVLLALSMANSSLILLWHESPEESPVLSETITITFHGAALVTGVILTHFWGSVFAKALAAFGLVVMIACIVGWYRRCPRSSVFGGKSRYPFNVPIRQETGYFQTPFVPVLPCAAILFNWFLIAQLAMTGVGGMMLLLLLATIYYFVYAAHHSVGNNGGWEASHPHEAEITFEETRDAKHAKNIQLVSLQDTQSDPNIQRLAEPAAAQLGEATVM